MVQFFVHVLGIWSCLVVVLGVCFRYWLFLSASVALRVLACLIRSLLPPANCRVLLCTAVSEMVLI